MVFLKDQGSLRSKITLLLVFYIVFSESLKTGAKVYILEQSLELKLLLFSLVYVTMYKVPATRVLAILLILLFLGIFETQTGLMMYVFLLYLFFKLYKMVQSLNRLFRDNHNKTL